MNSAARIVKHEDFAGRLGVRPVYVYLPPGYDDDAERDYPVLYMHDGQNVFAAFEQDSAYGTWAVDTTATRLIDAGEIPPVVVVGLANGHDMRAMEYCPPYVRLRFRSMKSRFIRWVPTLPYPGRADRTAACYINDLHPWIRQRYRVRNRRDDIAVSGSSLGGILSLYFASDFPDFAGQVAALSTAFWIAGRGKRNPALDRLKQIDPATMRVWLDSGTQDQPGKGDDDMPRTVLARDILVGQGFRIDDTLGFMIDEGGIHHESAWQARFDRVLRFLFAPRG